MLTDRAAAFHVDFGQTPYHTLNATTTSPLLFNRVLLNTGNGFDVSTGIFTAPFSGLYTFTLYYIPERHNGTTDLGIYLNGTRLAVGIAEGYYIDKNDQGSCTAVTHLVTGQQVYTKLSNGEPLLWGSPLTSLTGMLVHYD